MSVQDENYTAGPATGPVTKPAVTEFAAGAVFFSIALVASWSLWTDPYLAMGVSGDDPGPAFVPWIGTCVIGFGGLAQMVWTSARARKTGGMRTAGEFVLSKLLPPAVLVLLLVAYQIAMQPLGFVTSSTLFAVCAIAIIHWRAGGIFNVRYFLQLPVEAVLIVTGVYLVFSYGIHVPFP